MAKKIALLHRFPAKDIPETNGAFKHLAKKPIKVITFRRFDRMSPKWKLIKSVLWILYAPLRILCRGYDVIYCDDSFPFYPITVRLAAPRAKIVLRLGDIHLLYYCNGKLYRFLHRFELKGWRMADKILVVSDTMREYVEHKIGKGKVFTVPDPVDLDNFSLEWKPAKERIVMFHGTLTENKGIEKMIKAAAQLPHVRFVIIGDGPARSALALASGPNVEFRGWVNYREIADHLRRASVGLAMRANNPGNELVVTSPWLQYNALGVPCAVSRRRVFDDLGYPYQFDTVDELVALIKKLLEHPDSWKKWVRRHNNARTVGEKIWTHLSAL